MTDPTRSDRARAAAGLPPTPTAESPASGTSVAVRVQARIAEIDSRMADFDAAVPRGMEARQIMRDAATAVRNIPALADCTRSSFLGALMTAAQLGLRPNVPALGHGWILPFENRRENIVEAQFILGYQGMVELVERTGKVLSIKAATIYANEKHRIVDGLDEVLEHERIFRHAERGEPILHYAIARFTNGGVAWHVMGEDDIEAIKLSSKGSRSAYSPWNTNRDAMARKSVVRQLFKFLPKTTELAFAIAADEQVRTDLDRDAMGATVEPMQTVTVVERAPETAPADPPTDSPAQTYAGDSGQQDAEAPPSERKPYAASALRRGLITATMERHGTRLPEAVEYALAHVPGVQLLSLADLTDDPATALSYVSTEHLRQLVSFDLDDYLRVQEEAVAEQQLLDAAEQDGV